MGQLERALRRLDGAVTRLETAIGDRMTPASRPEEVPAEVAAEVEALAAERDRLAEEIGLLNARAAEDARLRAEAARAVRSALHDLRGAVGQGVGQRVSQGVGQGDGPGNAQGDG